MAWELAFWIISFLVVAALLGITVYQLLSLSDLEFDYINPFEASQKINQLVIPEYVIHSTLTIAFLLFGYWFMFLANVPFVYFYVRRYMGNKHLLDVTEIFSQLDTEKKINMFKMAFYVSLICFLIYRIVMSSMEVIIDSSIESMAEM